MEKPIRARRDWPRVLAEQARSGLSVRAYCTRHGINLSLFYSWRRRLPRAVVPAAVTDDWVELRPVAGPPGRCSGVTLVSPSGWRVEVTPDFDGATLARVCGCVPPSGACWG